MVFLGRFSVLWLGKVCPRVLATLPRSPDRDPEAEARLERPQHEVSWGKQRVGSVTTSVSSCQESDWRLESDWWSGSDWSIITVQSVQVKKGRKQPRATLVVNMKCCEKNNCLFEKMKRIEFSKKCCSALKSLNSAFILHLQTQLHWLIPSNS